MNPELLMASRRKIEEIRHKKAASAGTASAVLASVLGDRDYASAVRAPDSSAGDLQRFDEMEQEIASLRLSLESMTMERDAAVVAREDLNAQIRVLRRRLQDAEEEQYRAEEDAAALKKELELLQHVEQPFVQSSGLSPDAEKLKSAEQEIDALRFELQGLVQQLRQEQQKTAALYEQFESVTADKCELQNALAAAGSDKSRLEAALAATAGSENGMLKEALAAASAEKAELQKALAAALASPANLGHDFDSSTASSNRRAGSSMDRGVSNLTDRSRHEEQVHQLQYLLEKQERGQQKLLNEIDLQSLDIERLFAENSSLSTSLKETSDLAAKWEGQLKESLKQNAELRFKVSELQSLQTLHSSHRSSPDFSKDEQPQPPENLQQEETLEPLRSENVELKKDLVRVTAKSEELQSQLEQMSVDLSHALQVLGNLTRAYQPALLNIESRLAGLHQDFKRSIY